MAGEESGGEEREENIDNGQANAKQIENATKNVRRANFSTSTCPSAFIFIKISISLPPTLSLLPSQGSGLVCFLSVIG